jgi:Asp-tRNA(Asn)/Glu-tRNA(Gln) amidotransferase A subunit family amidase
LLVAALCEYDAVTLAGMLRRQEVSAREVIAAHIARIEATDWHLLSVAAAVEAATGYAQTAPRFQPPSLQPPSRQHGAR